MRRLFFLLPLFLIAQQSNVAVLQFDAENISESEVRILTNRLNTELFNTGKFTVIERSQMEEVLKEQGLQQSGCVSSECAVEVGKLLGVDAMVTGSMGRLGSFYTISARMVDVETGKILNTVSKDVSGSIDILLTTTMAEIAAELSGTAIKKTAPPKLNTGSLSFNSVQDSVRIEIDGVIVGYTPLTLNNLQPKRYNWLATKGGFVSKSGYSNVLPGTHEDHDMILRLDRSILYVQTNPTNAYVIVGRDTLGRTPYSGKYSTGDLTFSVYKKGYQKISKRVYMELGDNKYYLNFKRSTGVLTIQLEQDKPHLIYINKLKRQTLTSTPSFDLNTGENNIYITRYGFHDYETDVIIEENKVELIKPALNPIKVDVNLLMKPDNQVVFSGRELIPKGTKQLKLAYGEHFISSSYPKYEPFSTTVTVDKQLPIDLKLELVPKFKKKALVRSILFPGLGQQYYESKTKALLFSVTAVGMGALLANTYTTYQDENPLVSQYQLDYQNATTTGDIESTWQTYQSQVSRVNDLQSQILMYGATLGATWVINILDALLFNGLKGD